MKRITSLALLTLVVVASAVAAVAQTPPAPVFGPTKYEITAPPQQLFTDQFNLDKPGLFLVSVINGDIAVGGDHRVTSATLVVGPHPVFPPGEINDQVKHLERRIFLDAGPKRVIAVLNGEPATFITVTVVPLPMPNLRAGKLSLDFGTREGDNRIVLFLHNNNFVHERAVRLIFLDMLGRPAGVSDLLTIPPSATLPVSPELVPAPAPILWQQGSIDVIWMGPGGLPVTGYAEQVDRIGRKTILALHNFPVPLPPEEIE